MAPKIAALTIQSREDADDDGSDSIYNHPAIMFLGLLLLCFCIMAPMFWMLWMMRNDNRENVRSGQRLQRVRNWKRVNATHQQQAPQQPIAQHGGETLVAENRVARLSNAFSKNLLRTSKNAQRAVASQTQLLWRKISQSLPTSIHPVSRRNRSHSRAGVSIDLPIMRQPAWQSLASGSVGVTPSTTCGECTNHTPADIEMTEMKNKGPREPEQAEGSGAKTDLGELGLHGVTDRANGGELRMIHSPSTVGLALG